MAEETTDKSLGAPLIIGVLSMIVLIGLVITLMPDSNKSDAQGVFEKTGSVQDTSKALKNAPKLKPIASEGDVTPKKKELSPEAKKRRELVKKLRERFDETELKFIARSSLKVEKRAIEELGESDAAYEKMDEEWAKLCKEKGITEEERDALEDEALRQAWIKPLLGDD